MIVLGRRFIWSVIFVLFSLQSVNADVAKVAQFGAAFSKMPAVILSDYYYAQGLRNNAAICDTLYAALDLAEFILKTKRDINRTSVLEHFFVVYQVSYLIEKIFKIGTLVDDEVEAEQSSTLCNCLKYSGLLAGFLSSIASETLDISHDLRGLDATFFSRVHVFSKIFAMGVGNRAKKNIQKYLHC
jgi:hypothetical protein